MSKTPTIFNYTSNLLENQGHNISMNSAGFALFNDGIITFAYTGDMFISSVYTLTSFLAYNTRETLRNYTDDIYFKAGVGFMGGIMKYSLAKDLIDFNSVHSVDLDTNILKSLIVLVGGINHSAYEVAIALQEKSATHLNIETYWYFIPQVIENSESLINYAHFSSRIEYYNQNTQESFDRWLGYSVKDTFIGVHFYSGLTNTYYSSYKSLNECLYENTVKSAFFGSPFLLSESNIDIKPIIMFEMFYIGNCFNKQYAETENHSYTTDNIDNNMICNGCEDYQPELEINPMS